MLGKTRRVGVACRCVDRSPTHHACFNMIDLFVRCIILVSSLLCFSSSFVWFSLLILEILAEDGFLPKKGPLLKSRRFK